MKASSTAPLSLLWFLCLSSESSLKGIMTFFSISSRLPIIYWWDESSISATFRLNMTTSLFHLMDFIEGNATRRRETSPVTPRPPMVRCPMIRGQIRNGRVRVKSRGRVAQFSCNPGFTLLGARVATCDQNQWSHPLPICAGEFRSVGWRSGYPGSFGSIF